MNEICKISPLPWNKIKNLLKINSQKPLNDVKKNEKI